MINKLQSKWLNYSIRTAFGIVAFAGTIQPVLADSVQNAINNMDVSSGNVPVGSSNGLADTNMYFKSSTMFIYGGATVLLLVAYIFAGVRIGFSHGKAEKRMQGFVALGCAVLGTLVTVGAAQWQGLFSHVAIFGK